MLHVLQQSCSPCSLVVTAPLELLSVLLESSCSLCSSESQGAAAYVFHERAALSALLYVLPAELQYVLSESCCSTVLQGDQKEGAAPCVPVELLSVFPESSCSIIPMLGSLAFLVCRHCSVGKLSAYNNMADLFTHALALP